MKHYGNRNQQFSEDTLDPDPSTFLPDTSWGKSKLKNSGGQAELWTCCCALTQVEGEVDRIGVLDAIVHGRALPPCALLAPVEVRQEAGVVAQLRVWRVAAVARARRARLHAVVLRWGAAHVGCHHRPIEGEVFELGHAAARGALLLIVAGVHRGPGGEVAVQMKREQEGHSKGCVHVYELLESHSHLHVHVLWCGRRKGMKTLTWQKYSKSRKKEVQCESSARLPLFSLQHVFPLCGVEWSLCRNSSHQGQHEAGRGGTRVWGLEGGRSPWKTSSTCWSTHEPQHL